MTSKVIFTVYIDPHEIYNGDADYKSIQLSKHFNALTHRQEEYAKRCGADYKIYKIDDAYKTFLDKLDDLETFRTFALTDNGYKVTGPEGYVLHKDGDMVKLVNRLEFSYINFTLAKKWR